MLCLLFHHSPESLVDSFTCFVEYILKLTLTPEILDYIGLNDSLDFSLNDNTGSVDKSEKKDADTLSDYSSLKETDDAKKLTKENLKIDNKVTKSIGILVVTILILEIVIRSWS
jgi:hypothetical protein